MRPENTKHHTVGCANLSVAVSDITGSAVIDVPTQHTNPTEMRQMADILNATADNMDGGPVAPKPKRNTVPPLGPQHKKLIEHFRKKGSITGVEAAALYKVRSLPRRIADLKVHGWSINSEIGTDVTGQRYARYFCMGEPAIYKASA